MTTITREQLIGRAQARLELMQAAAREFPDSPSVQMDLELARIALASLDAEPVADVVVWHKEGEERTCDIRWRRFDVAPGALYAVPQPAPVVPDEMAVSDDMNLYQKSFSQGHNACRAAMLQGGAK